MSDDSGNWIDYPPPKPPRITRTRWQLVRWHLKCAWLHALGRLR